MKSPSVPRQPPPDNSAADAQARVDAERAALADSKMRGRRATMVGGALIAEQEQMGRGAKNMARRTLGV